MFSLQAYELRFECANNGNLLFVNFNKASFYLGAGEPVETDRVVIPPGDKKHLCVTTFVFAHFQPFLSLRFFENLSLGGSNFKICLHLFTSSIYSGDVGSIL